MSMRFSPSCFPEHSRLGFATEGCNEEDFQPWSNAVKAAAEAAKSAPCGRAWRWARSAPSPSAVQMQANIDSIVEVLTELTGDGQEDSQCLANRAHDVLRGVGILSGRCTSLICAATSGISAGDIVGILTCLRGKQYRSSLSPTAAARMTTFAEPPWPELGSDGPAFDRWLHSGLRCLDKRNSDGNIVIAPAVAVTLGPHVGATMSVWLFAVAYALEDIPAGGNLSLARASNHYDIALDGRDLDNDSPPTDDEDEYIEDEVDEIAPILDLQESQLAPEYNDADADDAFVEGKYETPDDFSDVEAKEEVAVSAAEKKPRRLSTWQTVINALPSPVDWTTSINLSCPDLVKNVGRLNIGDRPLRVGTPCAGFEAPVFALRGLGVTNYERTFAIDFGKHAASFGHALTAALGSPARCHWLGPSDGDVMKKELHEFPSVDLLIAGPPCPPWSRYGRRRGRDDPRARVFWKVIDLIGDLASRDAREALQCFILENVGGIMSYDAHHRRGIEEVYERLKKIVPDFQINTLRVNSKNYSLPQSRPRIYIVGIRNECLLTDLSNIDPQPHATATTFPEWLAPWERTPVNFHHIPERLQTKKRKWDQHLDERDSKPQKCRRPRWRAATANIERDRDKRWASSARTDGLFGTITTQDRLWMWVRPRSTENDEPLGSASQASQRYVMPIEALAMQGFPMKDPLLAGALDGLSDAEVLFGAGNAMSVPVVGSILAEVLQKTRLSDILSGFSLSPPRSCADSTLMRSPQTIRRFPATPQNIIVIEDSQETSDAHLSVPDIMPRFPKCRCWLHLVKCNSLSSCSLVHVNQNNLILGRDPSKVPKAGRIVAPGQCDSISRVHALLSIAEGIPHVTDLGSLHGTAVRGRGQAPVNLTARDGGSAACASQRFLGMPLSHNDVIAFGAGNAAVDKEFAFSYRVILP